jgi:hypothetical protein
MSMLISCAAAFGLGLVSLHCAAAKFHWALARSLAKILEWLTVAVAVSIVAVILYLAICGSADASSSAANWLRNLEQELRDWFHRLRLG